MTGYVADAKAVTGIRNVSPFNYLGGYRAQGICWRCLRIWKQPLRLRPPRKTERTSPDASLPGRCAVSQEPPCRVRDRRGVRAKSRNMAALG